MEYNGMYNNMTVLTQKKFDLALSNLTLSEAKRELLENASIRSFKEILASTADIDVTDESSLKTLLKQKIHAIGTNKKEDLIEETDIDDWVESKNPIVIEKPKAIKIAFALELSLLKAEEMIIQLCGERIHWRDPNELVCGFALNTGRSYKEACDLYTDLEKKGIFEFQNQDASVFTESIEYDLLGITTPEDLERYLTEHREMLGEYHNTARSTLIEFLDFLKRPSDSEYVEVDAETKPKAKKIRTVRETLSTKTIIKDVLYRGIVKNNSKASGKKNTQLSDALEKFISEGWPEETKLCKMKAGKFGKKYDVTRKVLILLFLATDGANSIYSDWRDVSPEDAFEDRLSRLNTMLVDCGYSLVDPRSPFDWIVLYCLCGDDGFIDDEKLSKILSTIFIGEAE